MAKQEVRERCSSTLLLETGGEIHEIQCGEKSGHYFKHRGTGDWIGCTWTNLGAIEARKRWEAKQNSVPQAQKGE
jgi:hypothetical protein